MAASSILKNISLDDKSSIENFITALESATSAQKPKPNMEMPTVQELTDPSAIRALAPEKLI